MHKITKLLDINTARWLIGLLLSISVSNPGPAVAEKFCHQLLRVSRDLVAAGRGKLAEQMAAVSLSEKRWGVDHDQRALYCEHMKYECTFREALGFDKFEDYLWDRKRRGSLTHVFDLFGSAAFVEFDGGFDSLTGARLEYDPPYLSYPEGRWSQVNGNFLTTSAWRRLRTNLSERNIPGFDLIIFRPIKGSEAFYDGTMSPEARQVSLFHLYRIFRNSYNLLSQNNGVILIELNKFGFNSPEYALGENKVVVTAFFEFLKTNSISYELYPNGNLKRGYNAIIIKVTKTALSPETIN